MFWPTKICCLPTLCLVPMEMTIGCPEVGQTDNLAHLGIKGTPTEILLLPTFSNAIFSKSFNFGFCVWGSGVGLFGWGAGVGLVGWGTGVGLVGWGAGVGVVGWGVGVGVGVAADGVGVLSLSELLESPEP